MDAFLAVVVPLVDLALSLPTAWAIGLSVVSATVATWAAMRFEDMRGIWKPIVWVVVLPVVFYGLVALAHVSPVLFDVEDLARSQSIR